jgi:hypothetical protein
MADYQNNPQQQADNSGSTQMFRAFVDDGSTTARQAPQPSAGAATTYGSARTEGGSKAGLVIGVIVVLAVIAGVVYFAIG